MTIKTKRLTLRPFAPDDFDAVHSWASNPENARYMSWGPNDADATRAFLASVTPGKDFAVALNETGAVIGSCGIYPDEAADKALVGWILHKDYWRRGYGSELGGELIKYGFESLKLRRIFAPCAAVNYGSRRVMERNGMRREALHRKAFWARVDKEWIDEAVYAILAEEYFQKPSPFIGKSANVTAIVAESDGAKAVGSGDLDVLATPTMIAFMERAACKALAGLLSEGQTSVGTSINVEHLAASPIGAEISATATVKSVSGKKVEFDVTASDNAGEIGKGVHTRVILDAKRFMEKTSERYDID
jgi:RimJ/RimL family protein N-acetyltransferase/predicted thioesterase